jgi:hypothetical protein
MTDILDSAELGAHLNSYRSRLFRMETLPEYTVDSDGGDFQRWLAGEAEPTWDRKDRWLDTLRRERAQGRISSRVRIISEQPTDYERYSCEFGYALNAAAGEDIRILHRGEHSIPALDERDFWIIDDDEAVAMHYDDVGRFCGAEVLPATDLPILLLARDVAWAAAEPFPQWWARHPEFHRKLVA